MATTIHEHHTVPPAESAAGWAALLIVLFAVLIAGALYFSGYFASVDDDNDINIDLPETTQPLVPDTDTSPSTDTEAAPSGY